MRDRRDDLPLTADINVTSLVDVAFTLLVIFIITAPVLQGGIQVDVPESEVDPLTAVEDRLTVSVTRDNRIFVERTELQERTEYSIGELRSRFGQILAAARPEMVYIKGDSLAHYGPVNQVISVVSESGVDYALVAIQWDEG